MSVKSALRTPQLSARPLALRAVPPVIISQPGPEFQNERRRFAESLAHASRGYVAAGGPGFAGLTDEPRK